MLKNDANHQTSDLTTPERARTPRRRRARRLGVPTAALVALLGAALVGSGFSSGSSAAPATAAPASQTQAVATTSATKTASSQAAAKVSKAKAKKAARAKAKMKAKKRKAKLVRMSKKYPRKAAKKMMKNRGYSARQRSCVIKLWNKESNWRWWADNPSSSAYGIPQALPGRKMASAGRDWRTNPVTQIKWGLKYIKQRHGSPCGAWNHSKARGWY